MFQVFFYTMISLLLSPAQVYGGDQLTCPGWYSGTSEGLPECPEGQMIPETYPAAAIVISDETEVGRNKMYAVSMAKKVIQATAFKGKIPALLMSAKKETIDQLKSEIDAMPIPFEAKEKAKAAIVHVDGVAYPWQQDYFKSFVDSSSGAPVLREVQDYEPVFKYIHNSIFNLWTAPKGYGVKSLQNSIAACGYKTGNELLQSTPRLLPELGLFNFHKGGWMPGGTFGGNLTSLPGGLCVVGSDNFHEDQYWKKYTSQFCSLKDSYKAPTNWLDVGHTDEILRVVKNNSKKEPCNFSLTIASPRKAIELLSKKPSEKFYNAGDSKLEANRYDEYAGLKDVCEGVRTESKKPQPKASGAGAVTKLIFQLSQPNAQAGPLDFLGLSKTGKDCALITNAQVVRQLTSKTKLAKYNDEIQRELDQMKKDLVDKYKKRMPSCEIDFIEVPNIFAGGEVTEYADGSKKLPRGKARSILPGPTNSVILEDTVISPEPMNDAFKTYLTGEYEKRGLTAEYQNTSFSVSGSLHCMTQTIHTCRPKVKK